jgi:hypothetical protein
MCNKAEDCGRIGFNALQSRESNQLSPRSQESFNWYQRKLLRFPLVKFYAGDVGLDDFPAILRPNLQQEAVLESAFLII